MRGFLPDFQKAFLFEVGRDVTRFAAAKIWRVAGASEPTSPRTGRPLAVGPIGPTPGRPPINLFGPSRGKTATKIAAASRPGGMRRGGRCVAKRLADLRETRAIEPALLDAAADGPTICTKLASTHVVMPALMMIDEQTHGSGLARNEGRIDHQKLRIRHGYSKIGQARVQHVAYSATAQFAGGDLQAAVRLQANGRRGPDDSATHCPIEQCGGGCHQQVPHTHIVSFPRLNIARPGRGPRKKRDERRQTGQT